MSDIKTHSLSDIFVRDPFILPVPEEGYYYLYGTTDSEPWRGKGVGFDAYRSEDLATWRGPYPVFRPWEGFWADENFWAPEVHCYQGRYYMFASFHAVGRSRATQILVSDTPLGSFTEHSDGPVTPPEWDCLDGTLHVEDGAPWMVFCREWPMIRDGQMLAIRLSDDLRSSVGDPVKLFDASAAPWARLFVLQRTLPDKPFSEGYITDGPWLHSTRDGRLLMLWSSFSHTGAGEYVLGVAGSESGKICGPWTQCDEPLFDDNGGHGMLFTRFDGQLMLTLHQPNRAPDGGERARLFEVEESDTNLRIVSKMSV